MCASIYTSVLQERVCVKMFVCAYECVFARILGNSFCERRGEKCGGWKLNQTFNRFSVVESCLSNCVLSTFISALVSGSVALD